jgi:hypothetical protein
VAIAAKPEVVGLLPARPKASPKQKCDRQKDHVLLLLGSLKRGRGLEGKEIAAKLPKLLRVGESTLRRHVLTPLSQAGKIINTKGVGYHLPE